MTFDLQRFDIIDIIANNQTVTLTEGADTIYIDAATFTSEDDSNVTFKGNFGADDKIFVYWLNTSNLLQSYKLNFGTSLNISGTHVTKDFSIKINGGFNSLTWTEIKDNSATATRYGVKNSDDQSIVLDTVDTEQNGQTFTLTGINSTEGITFDGKTITVPANNIDDTTKTVTTDHYELAVTGKDAA